MVVLIGSTPRRNRMWDGAKSSSSLRHTLANGTQVVSVVAGESKTESQLEQ